MVNVLYCGQIVKGIVSGLVYNMNFWILNVHLQLSVVVPVTFVLKVYRGSILHNIVKLCLTKKMLHLQEQNFPLIS